MSKIIDKIKDKILDMIAKAKAEKLAKMTPEQIAAAEEKTRERQKIEKEKQAARAESDKKKEEAFMAKRKVLIEKKLASYNKKVEKQLADLKSSEAKLLAKTDDATQKREVELLVIKKREEIEAAAVQQRRVIESSGGNRLSYERKKKLYGYGFISIWLIGTLYMFVVPMIQSINYSLHDTTLVSETTAEQYGMTSAGIHLEWNDFGHYHRAFYVDRDYVVVLAESLLSLAPDVLLILIFSLFIAVLLNQKFKGRTVMRAIFFLPVLIATGPVISVINGDILSQGVSGGAQQFSTLFQTDLVDGFLRFLGMYNISEEFTNFVSEVTSDIFNLLWKSGIQILIFLSALQQIPTSAKEAASMEGATGWEFFWKISFPTISPMILANLIYTIIDTFSDSQNPVMRLVISQAKSLQYGYSAAIAWIYFAIIAVALAIIVAIVSKFVFYQVD